MSKMIANGEQVDILVNLCNMYVEGAVRGDLLELTDLLEKEGKGILSTIGKKSDGHLHNEWGNLWNPKYS